MIKAIVFDLDDTLYPEIEYVQSGFCRVAAFVESKYKVKNAVATLNALFDENHKNVFDRLLDSFGLSEHVDDDVAEMIRLFRTNAPQTLEPFEDVYAVLKCLKQKGYKTGIITDGRPNGQRAKIAALGLNGKVDAIIVSDELGGEECRKPCVVPFEKMCELLGVLPQETVYVGDNPEKDFAIKRSLPITTVQSLQSQGVYRFSDYLDGIKPDYVIDSLDELTRLF